MDYSLSNPRPNFLEKFPQLQIVLPTAFLLLGQISVAFRGPGGWSLGAALLLAFSILFGALVWATKKWKAVAALLVVSASTFSLGYVLHYRALRPNFSAVHLRSLGEYRDPIYLEGVLFREPERLINRSRWYFRAESVWYPTGAKRAEGKILVTVQRETKEWHYGDRVRFRIRVRPPPGAANPGEFDYASYLARRNIYLTGYLVSDAAVELVRREAGGFWTWIESLRRRIRQFFEQRLPFEKAAILKALVIGDRGWISKTMRKQFAASGLAHLLAISGLHVGMLGVVVFVGVRYLGGLSPTLLLRYNLLKIATGTSFFAVLFYTVLAGAKIPTIRSAIMIGIYELAIILDREDEILNSLFLAALLIALYWPGAVMEVSFQLSFLAVLFIVSGLWKMQQWWSIKGYKTIPRDREKFTYWFRPVALYLSVPVLAILGTGPMIAYHFGFLSLAGLISNPLVVPVVGFLVVPLGLAMGLFSLISPTLGIPIIWICQPLLSVVQSMVGFFAHLPLSHIPVAKPTFFEIILIYSLFSAVFLLRGKTRWALISVGLLLILIVGDSLYWWHQRWGRRNVRMTFLSVGHGDAAVVELPGGKVLLIDAGGTTRGGFDKGNSIVRPFLLSRRILKVDYVLLSHARVDHYGGLEAVFDQFKPEEYWYAPEVARSGRLQALEEKANQLAIKSIPVYSHQSCRWVEQAQICFLFPLQQDSRKHSVVARLSFKDVHVIFPGDIQVPEERLLLRVGAELKGDVIKVPRHGSRSSSSEPFINEVKPKLAIFSVGQNNSFGLPKDQVVDRYADRGAVVLRTDQDGAITVETNGKEIWYWTYRTGRRGQLG